MAVEIDRQIGKRSEGRRPQQHTRTAGCDRHQAEHRNDDLEETFAAQSGA